MAAPSRTASLAPRSLVVITLAVAFGLPTALLLAVLGSTVAARTAAIDGFVRDVLRHDPATWGGTPWVQGAALALLAVVLLLFGLVAASFTIWWEIRLCSRMQSRIGYNRTGSAGFLQWLADGVKLIFKEDLVPAEADALLFRAAPYFAFVGFALTLVALPFGESVIAADLNVGIFYMLAVPALGVVANLLAGWSSNSKWALFGGMRAAAQVISYEIPAGIAVMVPVMMAGTLSMQGIIREQGGWPWEWFAFRNPAAAVAFLVFFISQLAESNRTPFDLAEAESELVAGHLSEYSGFRYALFFMVEFGNVWVMSAIAVTLFFGGWQLPLVGPETWVEARGSGAYPAAGWWGLQALSMTVFIAKAILVLNVIIWIRWTLPRIRIDQLMALCWKYLVPAAFAVFVFTLLWEIAAHRVAGLETATGMLLFGASLVALALFVRRTLANIRQVHGDRIDLSNW